MARVLINLPAQARRGEVIEIKTLIAHPMETGYRVGPTGAAIPRDIINRFLCTYNGAEVFRAELFPAIAAKSSSNCRRSSRTATRCRSPSRSRAR